MARRSESSLPQPPWVWSPSEVDRWIREAYPSKGRPHRHGRTGPETVTRLRFWALEVDAGRVRALLADSLDGIGVTMAGGRTAGSSPGKRKRLAVVSLRRALLRARVHVSVRFEPPIHPSSCRRLLDRLARGVRITDAGMTEERARLAPRAR